MFINERVGLAKDGAAYGAVARALEARPQETQ